VIGTVVLTWSALAAGAVALAAFGLDSLIEIAASTIVIWQLNDSHANREQRALRLIASAFIALATIIAAQAAYTLITTSRPGHSTLGIAWTALTCAVMLALAAAKAESAKHPTTASCRPKGASRGSTPTSPPPHWPACFLCALLLRRARERGRLVRAASALAR